MNIRHSQYKLQLLQSQMKISKDFQKKQNVRMPSTDELKMKKGCNFWSIQQNLQTLYNNFYILSYFSNSCEVRILSRLRSNQQQFCQYNYIDQFSFKGSQTLYMVEQRRRLVLRDEKQQIKLPLVIQYSVYKQSKIQKYRLHPENKLTQIKVQFYTQKSHFEAEGTSLIHFKHSQMIQQHHRQIISITITDNNNWINSNFTNIEKETYHTRLSQFNKSKINQFQYFYKQPQNQRYKIIEEQHISLALQGGGCKGVQYIGAYKALRKKKPKAKISSVIGSSAGAIIGLAICCQLEPQVIIKQVCQKKLSKVTEDKSKYSVAQIKAGKNQYYRFFQQFFQRYKLFQPKILNIFKQIMQDVQFQRLILELIQLLTNCKIKQLFSYKQDIRNPDAPQQLNLVALIDAALMSGNAIKDIAVQCIFLYLNKVDKTKIKKIMTRKPYCKFLSHEDINQNNLRLLAGMLRMRDLYELTNTQFTATAVDINNYCLRFFNQKTSPNLPVCRAVQMSGSFPIAFKAQKWKKQWGMYYIHFQNIRRQIDLSGSELTDGGTLANFPIKYLDNQDMRPMYFSHVKTDSTVMYGIGLITDIQEKKNIQRLSEVKAKIDKIVKSKIGLMNPLCSWLSYKFGCTDTKKKQSCGTMKDTANNLRSKIPIFDFVLKLFQTYCVSKDNLIQQCFSHESYETNTISSYKKQIVNRPKVNQIVGKVSNLIQLISQYIFTDNKIQPEYKRPRRSQQQLFNILVKNIEYFKKQTRQKQLTQVALTQILEQMYYNFSTIFFYILNKNNSSQFNKDEIYDEEEQIRVEQNKKIFDKLRSIIRRYYKFDVQDDALISVFFKEIQKIKQQKIFVLCDIQKDMQKLQICCNIFLQFFSSMKNENTLEKPNKLFQALQKIYKTESQAISDFLMSLKQFQNSYEREKNADDKQQLRNKLTTAAKKMTKLNNMIIATPIKVQKKIFKAIVNSQIPQLFIHYEAISHKKLIQSYTYERITKYQNQIKVMKKQNKINSQVSPPDGIHIVLQSITLSQFYFHQYYLIVKEALNQYIRNMKKTDVNQRSRASVSRDTFSIFKNSLINKLQNVQKKKLKVTTMTGTGYHSIIMFLHASDLQEEMITNQVWKLRELVKLDTQRANRIFEQDWVKITPILIREIQNQAIKNKKDIFEYLQQTNFNFDNKSQQYKKLKQAVLKQSQLIKISNQQMNQAIQNCLNYVVNCLMQIQQNRQDNIRQFFNKLVINRSPFSSIEEDYRNPSKRLKKLWNLFMVKFQDAIKHVFYNSPLVVNQVIQMLRPQQRQLAWKGVLASEIVSGIRLKQYVIKILQKLELSPNTTLKQFYNYSSKKIQLNFSVIQQNVVRIFNHITRPNMPVWAAVLSASSIPGFFPSVWDKPQWRDVKQIDYKKRQVLKYFGDKQKPSCVLFSSQVLTRLPIDLLRNKKFSSQITSKKNQIYMIFNFSDFKLYENKRQNEFPDVKMTPITLGGLVAHFVSFRQILYKKIFNKDLDTTAQAKNIKGLMLVSEIPAIKQHLRVLQLYVQSNDKLITKMYKRQLIQMPIRLNTLDFHLLTTKQPTTGQQRLSDLCQDAIMQAQFILSQKLQSIYNTQKQKEMQKNNLQKISEKKQMTDSRKSSLSLDETTKFVLMYAGKLVDNDRQDKDKIRLENYINKLQSDKQKLLQADQCQGEVQELKSNKIMYFRLESLPIDTQNNHINRKQKQTSTGKQFNLLQQSCSIILQQHQQTNHLKIRFLSILNPSRQIYQKYYINIEQKTQDDKTTYQRITKQDKILAQSSHSSLNLKIEFPSTDLRSIQIRYFNLDLSEIFGVSKIARQRKGKFGFVYRLDFNELYQIKNQKLEYLHPIQHQNDYMNRNRCYDQVPKIKIRSYVKDTIYQSLFCKDCTVILKRYMNKQNNQVYYSCPKCQKSEALNKKFKVFCNPVKGTLKCFLGDPIEKVSWPNKSYQLKQMIFCHLCGRGNIHKMWVDSVCEVYLCQSCKIENMQMNIDQ